jgi:hypothetical protein
MSLVNNRQSIDWEHKDLLKNSVFMNEIRLNNTLTLSFEPLDKKVRLIVCSAGKELACRKEYVKELQHFLTVDNANIFKGRLQLTKKKKNQINIILKNEIIGVISSSQLKEALLN